MGAVQDYDRWGGGNLGECRARTDDMIGFEANRGASACDGWTRREFLRAGGLAFGLSLADLGALQAGPGASNGEKACIQICLIGGPSQLDTWDLKPDAPDEIRGPFRPIATNVPGIFICEHFPRMARMADRYAIVRSVYHAEAPIHETGQQLLQTGGLAREGHEPPHVGAAVSRHIGKQSDLPPWVIVPGPLGETGVRISQGQSAGSLGKAHGPAYFAPPSGLALADAGSRAGLDPARLDHPKKLISAVDAAQCLVESADSALDPAIAADAMAPLFRPQAKRSLDLSTEPSGIRERYGLNTFGQSCLLARRLVQEGVRLVTINMFDTVFGRITWDCHASGGELASTLDDYARILCPMLDQAYAALLEDLIRLGMFGDTLVVAAGEFGRTPYLNHRGGRDHWPGVWSVLLAGGGVRGGQILGASDRHAEAPADRPVHAAAIASTVYHALGVAPPVNTQARSEEHGPPEHSRPLVELF